MAESESASQRLHGSRLIALCFISELRRRRAWRAKRYEILGFYVLALRNLVAPEGQAVAQPSPDRVVEGQAAAATVLQALYDLEAESPHRIECVANSLEVDVFHDLFPEELR